MSYGAIISGCAVLRKHLAIPHQLQACYVIDMPLQNDILAPLGLDRAHYLHVAGKSMDHGWHAVCYR